MKKINETVVFEGPAFKVNRKTFEDDEKNTFERDVVETPEVVHVIPMMEDGTICAIKEFRVSVEETVLGFPAGKVEKGEDPDEAVKREVEEEIGMKVTDLFPIHRNLVTTMGICNETGHYYIAVVKDFEEGERTHFPDNDEHINLIKCTPTEFGEKMIIAIKSGEKIGLKTAFLWLLYTTYERSLLASMGNGKS